MSVRILTVDDSKAVRIIVKKSFKKYAVEIIEASNGVEGLAHAAKETPDIILLDVTMPVMDGVEMLTKLKADPALKGIPVIMLTAEAGRENVMKIAKIGIRDYIVKPFKEDVLAEKVSRVVPIQLKEAVVEGGADAPPKENPWEKNFDSDDSALVVSFPADVDEAAVKGIEGLMDRKISDAVDNGLYKVVFDMSLCSALNDAFVALVNKGINNCQDLTLSYTLVGTEALSGQKGSVEGAAEWTLCPSLEEAKVG